MAGSVCSFRPNPQRALFSTSSRKTKVRPPYILQQGKGCLCKLYTDSHLPLSSLSLPCSPSISQFPSDYFSCYEQPPKSLSLFLIPAFHNLSYLFVLQKDCLATLWPHMASLPSFQTCFFSLFSVLTIYLGSGLLFEKSS